MADHIGWLEDMRTLFSHGGTEADAHRVAALDAAIAALSQPVAEAVAWEYVLVHTNHPSRGIQSTVPMLTYSEREAFSAGAINQKALVYALASSGLGGTGEGA